MNGPTFAPATPAAAPKQPPPRPAATARPPVKPDADAGGGMRIFTYLRLHWLMILFCGTLLGSAGAYAAWELMPSKYESYAMLQVSSAPFSIGNQNKEQARTDFVTYLKTTAALIKSEFVINAAIRDGRLHELATIKDQKEPIKFLDEEIQVVADGTEVIRITFKGHNPGDVKQVVDSVQQAFMKEVVQAEVARKRKDWDKVQAAMDAMRQVLERKVPEPKTARGVVPANGTGDPPAPQPPGVPGTLPQLTPNGPVIPAAPAGPAIDTDSLVYRFKPDLLFQKYAGLQEEVSRLPGMITDAKVRLRLVEAKLVELRSGPADPATLAAVDADKDVFTKAVEVNAAKRKIAHWAGIAKENSPGMIDARKELADAEAAHKKIRDEKILAIEYARRVEPAKKLRDEGQGIILQIDNYQRQLAAARERLGKVQDQLVKLPLPSDKSGGALQLAGGTKEGLPFDPADTDLQTVNSIFARLVAQYHLFKLELDSPERVRVLQTASQPTQKDMRKQILGTIFAGLMGYAIVALGVVAFETLSRRVSSLADLKSSTPTPVIGVIPCLPHEATGRDPVKRAAANEAIDKLRAYVAQTWLARGATTVAVTSPLGDEGKAFTAFGLASSLAQAGYRTLLVDFDLREPALHAYAGVPNQHGICEVLRGEVDVRSAVQSLPSGLHLVAAGKWSDEARKAAVGGKLETLLGRLREPYDCVVIHAHALLTVAETVEVARRCEAVLVSAQYRQTKMPLVKLAADRVAAMEVAHSGVVYVGATEQEALC